MPTDWPCDHADRHPFGLSTWTLAIIILGFIASSPSRLVAQERIIPTVINEQMRESSTLGLAAPAGFYSSVIGEALTQVSADSSRYNWKAGWIGMGVGAAVGSAFGALAPQLSGEGEGVDPGYVLGGALVFGIFGFVIGLAVGNS